MSNFITQFSFIKFLYSDTATKEYKKYFIFSYLKNHMKVYINELRLIKDLVGKVAGANMKCDSIRSQDQLQ